MYKLFMWLESTDRFVAMEKIDTFEEAVNRARLYFNRNPHHYYVLDTTTMEMYLLTPYI